MEDPKPLDKNFSKVKLLLASGKPLLWWKLLRIQLGLKFGSFPPFRHVEVVSTLGCNLDCQHCSAKSLGGKKTRLSLDDYRRIGQQCRHHRVSVVSFTGGEPLSDPRLERIIECFNPAETLIGITTNGTLADEKRLRRLKRIGVDSLLVSFDSPNPKIHDSFRNKKGVFKKAEKTVLMARKVGIEPIVITTVHHQNLREKDGFLGMIDLAKRWGVLLHVSLAAPAGKWANPKDCRRFLLTEDDQQYLRHLIAKNLFIRRDFDSNFSARGCPAGTERFVILPDGEVLVCTKIHVSFGNLREESMISIRQRMMKYKLFRETPPYCLCAESADFIEKYQKRCFGKTTLPLPEKKFFENKEADVDNNDLSLCCPVCGGLSTEPFCDDVADFEYRVEGYFPLVKCQGCGLVRQRFIPGYPKLNRYYPKDYLAHQEASPQKLGFFLALLKKQLYRQRAKRYARLMGRSGRVLDVGCANCSLLESLRSLGNYDLYGIDIKNLGIDYQSLGVKFKKGPLEKIDFKTSLFDLVVLDNLIEHVPNPAIFLEKVYRILKPGGWVVGTTPNLRSVDALLFGRYWGGFHLPRHFYLFNRHNLNKLLKRSHFINIKFPFNANPADWCVSIQNFLRRNQIRRREYRRGWYFSLAGCFLVIPSFFFSLIGWHSIMDFQAQKR